MSSYRILYVRQVFLFGPCTCTWYYPQCSSALLEHLTELRQEVLPTYGATPSTTCAVNDQQPRVRILKLTFCSATFPTFINDK